MGCALKPFVLMPVQPDGSLVFGIDAVQFRPSHLAFEISRAPNGVFDINTLHILY